MSRGEKRKMRLAWAAGPRIRSHAQSRGKLGWIVIFLIFLLYTKATKIKQGESQRKEDKDFVNTGRCKICGTRSCIWFEFVMADITNVSKKRKRKTADILLLCIVVLCGRWRGYNNKRKKIIIKQFWCWPISLVGEASWGFLFVARSMMTLRPSSCEMRLWCPKFFGKLTLYHFRLYLIYIVQL